MTISRNSADYVEILLVEDNPGDMRLIRESFTATERETRFQTARSGEEAMEMLEQRMREGESLPDLAILDLNLPRMDGCDVLEQIRDDSDLRQLPAVMLTGSNAREDINRCYNVDADAYFTKPDDPVEFQSLAQGIERFWGARPWFPLVR